MTVDISAAKQLLNLGARIQGKHRIDEQLRGAVAVHNLLVTEGIAYLADEVGMGKTYVALGAVALFRHFNPGFRVLFLAPRRNIQMKWIKEQNNFIEHNVRFSDMRNRAPDGRPIRSLVACETLMDLVRETALDQDRDFFARMSSFSLAVAGDRVADVQAVSRLKKEFRRHMPWLKDEIFAERKKKEFKDNMAKVLCCALPHFDLVVVDEAHNLKHGFTDHVAARNRVLGLALGRDLNESGSKLYPGYSRRAAKVLFLSATPVEDSYRQLWNQLDVFGVGDKYRGLIDEHADEDAKRAVAERFLVRRVTKLEISGKSYSRNLYRREWRRGGVSQHDEPIRVEDARERLVLALVQKKVSELLGHERFSGSFQVGMLASFESFHETTSRLLGQDPAEGNFDDADQTDDVELREGIDVQSINGLAQSFKREFKRELPHPKMDAVTKSLKEAWTSGDKALVFVRRVASVADLKGRLDDAYDEWLIDRLKRELPAHLEGRINDLYQQYRKQRRRADPIESAAHGRISAEPQAEPVNRGGQDTFFAWFFRGDGPRNVISGANAQIRFLTRSTFFEENAAAEILQCPPGKVLNALAECLGLEPAIAAERLNGRARHFLPAAVAKQKKTDLFHAAQAAACYLLKEHPGSHQLLARAIWNSRMQQSGHSTPRTTLHDVAHLLEERTFFTELKTRPGLRSRLWPETERPVHDAYRDHYLRAQLLASSVRLGHSLIDFYIAVINRVATLEGGRLTDGDDGAEGEDSDLIGDFLGLLDTQMRTPLHQRCWGAFDELSAIADNFDLILDVNVPDVRRGKLSEAAGLFGHLLRQQQPVGGMAGSVNQTLVRQFRMPGYPFVLVSTDLLQEGEDLHTFCSVVHHYGISWTPSAMEQRTGRIDRVRSQTDRRLAEVTEMTGQGMLQVHFPYLQDTVEVLQVQRVLERMNVFIRMMHEGLASPVKDGKTVDVNRAFLETGGVVPQITELLESAFPVKPGLLRGGKKHPAFSEKDSRPIVRRFMQIAKIPFSELPVRWEQAHSSLMLMGTAHLEDRIQPFTLLLKAYGERLMVRCVSPVGSLFADTPEAAILKSAAACGAKVGAISTEQERSYDLTVEGDVLLGDPACDERRVMSLIFRIVTQADALERAHVPDHDGPLAEFRSELLEEVSIER